MNIKIENLSSAIAEELESYSKGVEDTIDKDIDRISDILVEELKNNSNIPERTGKYKKSFYKKVIAKGIGYKRVVVANKIHQLTHLLEKTHLTRNGTSRTKAYPHWETAQKRLEELMEEMELRL